MSLSRSAAKLLCYQRDSPYFIFILLIDEKAFQRCLFSN